VTISEPVLDAGTGYKADGTPDVFNESSVDRLFDDGREMTDKRVQRKDMLKKLLEASYAPKTRSGYNRHAQAYCTFCESQNPPLRPLPAEPGALAMWVADLALREDEHTGEHYQTTTISQMVSAVGKWHTSNGWPNPVTDDLLGMIRRGYGHVFGRNPEQALPILREALLRIIETTYTPTALGRRDRVVLLALTREKQDLGPRPLERFRTWDQVEWPSSPGEPAGLLLPCKGGSERVEILPDPDPDLDLVAALGDLYSWSEAAGPPFANPDGDPITAGNFTRLAQGYCERAGVCRTAGSWLLPDEDRRRLVAAALAPSDLQVRDRSMFLTQWKAALRRGEVGPLTWRHLGPAPDEPTLLKVVVVRSKKDQKGKGKTKLVYPDVDPRLDTLRALNEWRPRAERILGRPVRPDDPVYFRLDQAANHNEGVEGLSGTGVNDRVKAAVATARLQGRYTAHSMRAGFATQAFKDGFGLVEVMEHLGQSDPRSPIIYKRGAARRGPANPTWPRDDSALKEAVIKAVLGRVTEVLSDQDVDDEPVSEVLARLIDDELAQRKASEALEDVPGPR